MNLTDLCIRRPVMAWVLFLSVLAIGGAALSRIGVSQFPDVDFPTVSVAVTWEGASAEAVEADVIQVLEDALAQIDGIERLASSAKTGSASLSIEFAQGSDIDAAMQDVQNKIGQVVRQLPSGIEPPTVSKVNPEDMPILWATISGPVDQARLVSEVRTARDRLRQLPGVGDVFLIGFRERALRIWLDPRRLDARGLTAAEVTATLKQQHVELPAGRLEAVNRPTRDTDVRLLGEAPDVAAVRRLVVGGTTEAPVTLDQVALVEFGFVDASTRASVGGAPAMSVGVRKRYGSNQVEVAQAVRAEIERIRQALPDDMVLTIAFDPTRFIERSVRDLGHELLLAVILTSVVCAWALRSFAAAANVALAIPMSLLGTVAVLYWCGFTLNTFTLLGLALVVGLVVDDAIMVQESIARHRELGCDPRTAASRGTREIAMAALASSLAVVAIFIPVTMTTGVIGAFLMQFGVALCVAVMISYLEAVTLAPARAAAFARMTTVHEESRHRWYRLALGWSLRRPVLVVLAAALLAGGSVWLMTRLKGEFVPSEDQSRFNLRIDAPAGSNLAATSAIADPVEARLRAMPEVANIVYLVGGFGGGNAANATLIVNLVPPSQRQRSQAEIMNDVRRWGATVPGARVTVVDPSSQAFTGQRAGGAALEFSVRADDWDLVRRTSQDLVERLRTSGVCTDVDSDFRLGRPELALTIDRERAAALGVDAQDIAETLQLLAGGVKSGKFSDGGRRYDIRVRALADDRLRPADLERYRVRARSGALVPLADLVHQDLRPTVNAILRKDRSRAITITANPAPGATITQAQAAIDALPLPSGVRLVAEGSSRTMRESFRGLGFAFIGGLLAAYLLLAAQFNSFRQPIAVLIIMPLALVGASVALFVTGQTINVFSIIGVLLLMGIAKKNSILLVDCADRLREEGRTLHRALLEAGPRRLRPILMTSAATVAAAVPTALGLGEGGESRQPMAIAIIGGVAVSTALSLFVVPAFTLLIERRRPRSAPSVPD